MAQGWRHLRHGEGRGRHLVRARLGGVRVGGVARSHRDDVGSGALVRLFAVVQLQHRLKNMQLHYAGRSERSKRANVTKMI